MKKLALTSLVAVFAASSAMAANHVSNPMYRADKGMFYSYTTVETTSENVNAFGASEVLGYGITDRFSIELGIGGSEKDWFQGYALDGLTVGANWRVLSHDNWKMDLYGNYTVAGIWGHGIYESFMNEDDTEYTWTAGLRGGYVTDDWTIAGHVAFNYGNTESFNWDVASELHNLEFGVDGFLRLNRYWNLVAGVEYSTFVGHGTWDKHPGTWTAKFGANLTFDDTKYVGAYVAKEFEHTGEGEWSAANGVAFGATFGVEF